MLRLDAVIKRMRPRQLMPTALRGATMLILALTLSGVFGVGLALADEPEGPPAPAVGQSSGQTGTPKSFVPESFNVNEYLRANKDQKTLVPSANNQNSRAAGITGVLVKAIDLMVRLVGSISLIVFIIGAVITIASGGKEDRLEFGKTTMVYSLIGLVVTFMSFIIVTFVQSVLF